MNRTLHRFSLVAVLLVTSFSLASASSRRANVAQPQDGPLDSQACVGGSGLSGYYGMLVSGTGKYLAGTVYFDGNCNVSGSNISGGSAGQYTTTSVTGTYGQNTDGTVNLTLNFAGQTAAQTYLIGISESGIKARGLESDGTTEAVIDLQSQLTTLPSGYNTASLSGTYSAYCGNGSSSDLNYVTFDGKGNLTGIDPYDSGGSQGNSPYSGTYSVNSDGTFSGNLVGSYSSYSFNGVIDNGINEIEYIYNLAGSGAVLSCVGKQAVASPANLLGYYGILVLGNAQTGGGGKYLSGSVFFNGAGALTAANLNGGINSTYVNTTATGTYSLNSDNTISITMNLAGDPTPQTYIVGVSQTGNEAVGIETDGTAVATIDIQAQLQLPSKPYSAASLNGIYSASCSGSEVDLNYVIFDGNGNLTGVDGYDNGGYGNSPYTGTYTVNSDGTFSGGFAGSYNVFVMTGVIENGNAEMEFTYNESGVGGVVGCIGESAYGPVGSNPVAATPSLSPAPGAYSSAQAVTLSDTTPNAVIYYTTNGLAPTTNSPVYSGPIQVTATTTVQAIAAASGYNNSSIGAGTYFLASGLQTAATPTFNPAPGNYSSAQSVTLLDTTPNAVIYYAINGNTNYTVYSTAIPVSATTTIQAFAVASGYGNSAVATGTYTITGSGNTGVNLSSYYNVYGIATSGNPTKNGGFDGQSGDTYNSSTLGTSATYQGVTFNFGPVNALDGISGVTVALPPGSYNQLYLLGAASYGAQTNQNFVVTYTDGTTSTFTQTLSDWWSSGGYSGETILVSPANIILSNGSVSNQPVHLYGYTFNLVQGKTAASVKLPSNRDVALLAMGLGTAAVPAAATPTFNPAPGSYSSAVAVTLSDTTTGAVIYYTTNGSMPTTGSPVYNGPITVSATATIKAIAAAAGYSNSSVASGTYTINGSGSTAVNLSSFYNVYGIATQGNSPQHGGFDNDGYAYNSSLLGTSLSYQNLTLPLGPANALDAVSSQTVSVTPGSYAQLYLLGAAVNGAQTSQPVVVTYSDGSTSTFSQNFSDWAAPKNYSGETSVIQTANRISSSGQTQSGTFYVYGYAFNLTAGKNVASVKLPSNRNVVFLAMGLAGAAPPTAATPAFSPAPGTYTSSQSITLSDSTPGAVIHYTTDGTTPTASSAVYGSAIPLNTTTTIEALAVASGYTNSAVATGVYTLNGTPIVPYIQVNGGSWQQVSSVTVTTGSSVNLGPQPLNVGSWSWTGPNGYTSTSRQINNIPLSIGSNVYVATYTNASGVQSTLAFTITVTASWTQISSTSINSIACSSDGALIVATSSNQSVYEYVSGKWTQLPGQMRRVALVNQNTVWGVGTDANVYRLSGGKWIKAGTNANYIAAGSDGTVLMTSAKDNSIWKYVSDNNWTSIPGTATVIAVVKNNNYFAVGSSNNVYQYNGSSWTTVGSNTAYVRAAADGTVLATNSSGQISQYVSPNNWVTVPGTMQIAAPVKLNSYFGMVTDNTVYSYGSH